MPRVSHISVFILFLLAGFNLLSQTGHYQIKNYTPKIYKGHNQIWSVTQDMNGVLYFGGTSYIFTFDGMEWNKIPVRPGSAVRQVLFDPESQTVYVGGVGSFGYIEHDAKNRPYYVSLSDSLSEDQKKFTDVWRVYSLNSKIYFQTSEAVYAIKNKVLSAYIPSPKENSFALSFLVGQKMFIRQRGKGLMEIKGENLVPVDGGEKFGNIRILEIMPLKKEGDYYVLSGDQGGWIMHKQKNTIKIESEPAFTDSFVVNSGVLGCRWVNDSIYVVHGRNGAAFFNGSGVRKEVFDAKTGLGDITISHAFIDRERNLWLTHNYGISCVSYNKGLSTYNSNTSGYIGALETILISKEKVYVATTEAINVCEYPGETKKLRFRNLKMPKTEVWDLKEINGGIFAATGMGLAQIKGEEVTFLNEHYSVQLSEADDPKKLLVLQKNGLSIYDVSNVNKAKLVSFYETPTVEFIASSKMKTHGSELEFWATTRYREIFHMKFDTLKNSWNYTKYDSTSGFQGTITLFPTYLKNEIYFCSTDISYKYYPERDKGKGSKCFDVDKKFFDNIYGKGGEALDISANYRMYFNRSYYSNTIFFGKDKNNKSIVKEYYLSELFDEEIQALYADQNNKAWALDPEHISIIDLNAGNNKRIAYQALITGMYLNGDSLIYSTYADASATLKEELMYENNNVRFSFSAPFFDRNDITNFTYILEGFDKSWSDTLRVYEKEYTNLPEGTYTFRVKAENAFGTPSEEASITFTILPPWYRTTLAYVIYVILFVLFVWGTVKVSSKRHIQRQAKLEQTIKERTAEVVQQKQLIEEKHKEITDSINYAERIQRSFLATNKMLDAELKNYFVLFLPKDIVSGDFYWAGKLKNGHFALMVADSTGHGVPGAIMSILNISSVEKAVEQGVYEPALILNETRKTIIERLSNDGSEEGGKEGMDGSIISFNFKNNTFTYAAAYNPIIVVRGNELIELKADKMPIGRHDRDSIPFTQDTFTWQSGDTVYAFTDGMPDQFGGPKGKKFMYKQMKKLLQEISDKSLEEQYQKIHDALMTWKSEYEQVDDICVVGVRL